MPDEVTPPEPTQAEARAAFLANPPEITSVPDPAPVLDDEATALDELTQPPAAGDGVEPAPVSPVPVAADPYAEYGGREAVANAMELDRALRTEQGVKLVVRQSLEALGYTDAQIRAALGAGPGGQPSTAAEAAAAQTAPGIFDGIEDDDVVTGSDVKRIVSQATEQAVQQALAQAQAQLDPMRQQFEQERVRDQASRNDATLIELLGPVPEDTAALGEYQAQAQDILNAAAKYVEQGNFDPAHVRSGIVKAHSEITAAAEARFKRYLAGKKQARDAAPSNIGGHTAGEAEAPEPKTLAEARAAARADGFFN